MAKISFDGFDDYRAIVQKIGTNADRYCRAAVYDGAAVVADAVKAETPADSGDLRESMGLAHMQNDDGYIYTQIYFAGYDEKGVPNPIKARVIVSGAHGVHKNPFIRRAVNRVRAAAVAAMRETMDRILENETK